MQGRTGFKPPLWALLLLALVSCDRAPVYVPDSDQRMRFLTEYYPSLKTLHDQLIFESLNCWRNLGTLKKMRSSFKEKEPLEMVSEKIREVEQQKASLERHVQKIQAEAEKGIAYSTFQKIDGGGTRPPALQELESECVNALARARESSAIRFEEPGPDNPGFAPPKAIPVWPPKALPVVDASQGSVE
jgi:hypothetical protein